MKSPYQWWTRIRLTMARRMEGMPVDHRSLHSPFCFVPRTDPRNPHLRHLRLAHMKGLVECINLRIPTVTFHNPTCHKIILRILTTKLGIILRLRLVIELVKVLIGPTLVLLVMELWTGTVNIQVMWKNLWFTVVVTLVHKSINLHRHQ